MPQKWHVCKESQRRQWKILHFGWLAACLWYLNYMAFLRPAADRTESELLWPSLYTYHLLGIRRQVTRLGLSWLGSCSSLIFSTVYLHSKSSRCLWFLSAAVKSSQVKLLITNNVFCIVQRATAQSKTGIFRDYGVAKSPPGFQAGWSDCMLLVA
jgi:hypothetical protein